MSGFYRRGDKVPIPKTKSVGKSIHRSVSISRAKSNNQDFLYFVKYVNIRGVKSVALSYHDGGGGNYFALSDLAVKNNGIGW